MWTTQSPISLAALLHRRPCEARNSLEGCVLIGLNTSIRAENALQTHYDLSGSIALHHVGKRATCCGVHHSAIMYTSALLCNWRIYLRQRVMAE